MQDGGVIADGSVIEALPWRCHESPCHCRRKSNSRSSWVIVATKRWVLVVNKLLLSILCRKAETNPRVLPLPLTT